MSTVFMDQNQGMGCGTTSILAQSFHLRLPETRDSFIQHTPIENQCDRELEWRLNRKPALKGLHQEQSICDEL